MPKSIMRLEVKSKETRLARSILAIISLLTMTIVGQQMLTLPLWGYRPLFLGVSFWIFLNSLLFPLLYRGKNAIRHFGLSSLSGLMLYLSFPSMPFTPLIFGAFVPLLIIIYEREKEKEGKLLPLLYNCFLLWNILSIFWLINTGFLAGVFTFALNALLMATAMMIYYWIKKAVGDKFGIYAFICSWICFELFHLHWEISFPWLHLGNAFSQYPSSIQWYEYTGMFGGTLWALVCNYLIFQYWRDKTAVKKIALTLIPLLLLPIAVSLVLLQQDFKTGDVIKFGIVQPNFEPHFSKFDIPQKVQADRFIRLSQEVADKCDVLLYPETSFGLIVLGNIGRYYSMKELNALMKEYPHVEVLAGLDAAEFTDKNDPSLNLRASVRPGQDTTYWKRYNSAIMVKDSVEDYQLYKKAKFVPGAEKFPYGKYLGFLEPMINDLGGSIYGLESSERRSALQSSYGNIAPIICYESVYGQYCSDYVKAGAQVFTIITNDGWWDNTPGHKQHIRIGQLRAIEQRKYIARSANSGTSAMIDAKGFVHQATDYDVEASFVAEAHLNSKVTFYAQWGDMIARISFFLFCIMIVGGIAKKWKERIEKNQ